MSRPARPVEDRFWEKVSGGDYTECWTWMASTKEGGYGQFNVQPEVVLAHRYAYISLVGDVPEGLELDHLCRNRACVNPWHLEPVTRSVNVVRGTAPTVTSARHRAVTACPYRHRYDEANTSVYQGRRRCKTCMRERARDAYARRRAQAMEAAA